MVFACPFFCGIHSDPSVMRMAVSVAVLMPRLANHATALSESRGLPVDLGFL